MAASIAIPGVIVGAASKDACYVDGGATNPVPSSMCAARHDIVVAVDVTGRPAQPQTASRTCELAIGSLLIMLIRRQP